MPPEQPPKSTPGEFVVGPEQTAELSESTRKDGAKIVRLIRLPASREINNGYDETYYERTIESGWVLARIIDAERVITRRVQVASRAEYNQQETVQITHDVVRDPIFVFERDAASDEAEQQLRKELDEAYGRANKLKRDFEALDESNAALVAENEKLQSSVARQKEAISGLGNTINGLQVQLKTTQDELEKAKRYIGEGRWQSIGRELAEDGK